MGGSAKGGRGGGDAHSGILKRFKELRKEGMGVKEAMAMARSECGHGSDEGDDPGAKVAAMFGMQV